MRWSSNGESGAQTRHRKGRASGVLIHATAQRPQKTTGECTTRRFFHKMHGLGDAFVSRPTRFHAVRLDCARHGIGVIPILHSIPRYPVWLNTSCRCCASARSFPRSGRSSRTSPCPSSPAPRSASWASMARENRPCCASWPTLTRSSRARCSIWPASVSATCRRNHSSIRK